MYLQLRYTSQLFVIIVHIETKHTYLVASANFDFPKDRQEPISDTVHDQGENEHNHSELCAIPIYLRWSSKHTNGGHHAEKKELT